MGDNAHIAILEPDVSHQLSLVRQGGGAIVEGGAHAPAAQHRLRGDTAREADGIEIKPLIGIKDRQTHLLAGETPRFPL